MKINKLKLFPDPIVSGFRIQIEIVWRVMFMFLTSDRPQNTLAAILATFAAIYILLVNLFY